jgi:predicted nucleic acid-binding protein
MPETISNTTPLQYLFQGDLLDLLPSLFGQVVIPEAVLAEVTEGRALGVSLPAIDALSWACVRAPKDPLLLPLVSDLGQGEREALALALESPGSLVILDDGPARRYAAHLDLRLIGTLGVLLRAKTRGLIPSVAPVLDRLDQLRFRVDAVTRTAVLLMAGESFVPR